MKVVIPVVEVRKIEGERGKNGKPYSFRVQRCWLQSKNSPFPQEFENLLDKDEIPLAVGEHELDVDKMVFVNRNSKLSVRLAILPPVKK